MTNEKNQLTSEDVEEVQKFLQGEKLDFIEKKYREVFDKIDYIQGLFQSGVLEDPNETDKVMKELTGYYICLNPITNELEADKKNIEDALFTTFRIKKEKAGEKITASSIEKEVSAIVAGWRRIRNKFQAYRDSCATGISVCQSSLKSVEKERKLPHG